MVEVLTQSKELTLDFFVVVVFIPAVVTVPQATNRT